jgi:hypothetical protein
MVFFVHLFLFIFQYCHHHYKSECNGSANMAIIKKCKTVPIARYTGSFMFLSEFTRLLKNPTVFFLLINPQNCFFLFFVQLSFQVSYKSPIASNFHRLYAFNDIDVCAAMTNPLANFAGIIPFCKKTLPQVCHKCPYKAGEIFNLNLTYVVSDCPTLKNKQKAIFDIGLFWPDGDYKAEMMLTDGPDSVALSYNYREKNGDKRRF